MLTSQHDWRSLSQTDLNAALAQVAASLRWQTVTPDQHWRGEGPETGWSIEVERLKGGSARAMLIGTINGIRAGGNVQVHRTNEHAWASLDAAKLWAADQLLFYCYLHDGKLPPLVEPPTIEDAQAVLSVVEGPDAISSDTRYHAITLHIWQGAAFRLDCGDPVIDLAAALAIARRWHVDSYNYTNIGDFARRHSYAWRSNTHSQIELFLPGI